MNILCLICGNESKLNDKEDWLKFMGKHWDEIQCPICNPKFADDFKIIGAIDIAKLFEKILS